MIEQQKHLDTRALELAAGANAVLQQHLTECRDRFLSLQAIIVKGGGAVIFMLLCIIGYLVANGGIPTGHH